MKWRIVIAGWVAALVLAGCKDSTAAGPAAPEQELKDGHPVVHLPPVETRPFDDGYDAGFDFGKQHATRQTPIPREEEAQRVAHEQAGERPERTERWERGFAQGYTEGVRNVVTGQK